LKLQTDYGRATMWSKGFASDEAKAAFDRAQELTKDVGDVDERFATLYGLFVTSLVRGELRTANEAAETFRREAESCGRLTEAAVAGRFLGLISSMRGELLKSKAQLEEALRVYDPERDRDTRFRYGIDTAFGATLYLSPVTLMLGDIEGARNLIDESVASAVESDRVQDLINAYNYKAMYEVTLGDAEAALRTAEIHAEICRRHQVEPQSSFRLQSAWAHARLGDRKIGMAELRQALAARMEGNEKLGIPRFQGLLAELEAEEQDFEGALARIDEALAVAHETENHLGDAFLHRLRGEILLKRDPANHAAAEEAFLTAAAIANEQHGRFYGLLAALSLARLYQSTGRPVDAHAILSPALEGFSPTPEMPEIVEAQTLLAALMETEEVKTAIAQRRRRLDLQTSYGQALLWGKGFAAKETEAAFARVGELAGQQENPAARFVASYAQCVGRLMRGEFPQAQEMAETFLREAEVSGRAAEAGAARRLLASVLLYQGDLRAARSFFERALADFVPDRDGDARLLDVQASAAATLASVVWHLGEVERARLLIQEAIRRARQLGHAATLVHVLSWNACLEIGRDDVAAARLAADALIKLAEEHGIILYAVMGQMCAYWASGRLVDPEACASGLRQALQAYMAQGNKCHAPFFHGMLAELEAAMRGPDSALTLIDQGLTIAEEQGSDTWSPTSIASAATSCSSATPPIPRLPRTPTGPPWPSPNSRARAATGCSRPSRSPSFIDRPAAPLTPAPSSHPRSRALRRRPRCLRSLRRRRCSRAWREPASAVKPISRSQWNAGCGADTGPSQGDPWRRTIRPVEASTAAICYVRSTSIRDVAQTSQMRKWRSLPNA
jgi:tetratricopeptide (TPR) repeat protein